MRIKSYLIMFLVGAFINLALVLMVVNFDSTLWDFTCGEISCWVLIVMDLPFSLFFLSEDNLAITKYSLTFGTLWWGTFTVILSFIVNLIKKLH